MNKMKENFNLKETVERVNKYFCDGDFDEHKNNRDFFDWIIGKVHCGKCGKIMSPVRSLFHFIHF